MTLLMYLYKIFGKPFVNKMMGTRTGVKSLPVGKHNPFLHVYSKGSLKNNPAALKEAEKILKEYEPYAFSNKNAKEMVIYQKNLKNVHDAKFPKEAEVIELRTQKPVTGKGLESLKDKGGIPKGVDWDSPMGKATRDVQAARGDLDRFLSGKGTNTLDSMMEDIFKAQRTMQPGGKMYREGNVRTALREFLNTEHKAGKLKLDETDAFWVKNYSPSGGSQDPIDIFRRHYGEGALEHVDSIADVFEKGESFKHYEELLRKHADKKFLTPRKGGPKKGYIDEDMTTKMQTDTAKSMKLRQALRYSAEQDPNIAGKFSDDQWNIILKDINYEMSPDEALKILKKNADELAGGPTKAGVKKTRDPINMRIMKNFEQELDDLALAKEGYNLQEINVIKKSRAILKAGDETHPSEAVRRVQEEMADAGEDIEKLGIDWGDLEPDSFAKGGRVTLGKGGLVGVLKL